MMRLIRMLLFCFTVISIVSSVPQAASWSTDVMVGTDVDILDVDLEYDWQTEKLFAVICWTGDGCTSYISSDFGDTWTPTFSQGGVTVNAMSCVQFREYFYVTISAPAFTAVYRFDSNTGASVNFPGGAPFLVVTTEALEDVIVTGANPDMNVLRFVGRRADGDILFASLQLPGETWTRNWKAFACDRGFDAITISAEDYSIETHISCITTADWLYVLRFVWGGSNNLYISHYREVGSGTYRSAVAAAGVAGEPTTVYAASDFWPSPGNLVITSSPDWVGSFVEDPTVNIWSPSLYCVQDWDVALAYCNKLAPTPSSPYRGRFRLHQVDEALDPIMSEPIETYTTKYVDHRVKPDIEYLWGNMGYGLLFAELPHIGGNSVYFTRRDPSCCFARVGDANGLGGDEPTISDASVMIDAKFITGTCDGLLECLSEADINQSGGADPTCDDITISDISTLIDYLFITGSSLGLPDCL